MPNKIFRSVKGFVASAALRFSHNKPSAALTVLPEPRRRPLNDFEREMAEDAWMFDAGEGAVEHRASMLSAELDRMTELLGGLHEALTSVSQAVPSAPANEIPAFDTPYFADSLLFEGESSVWVSGDVFVDDDAFLFDDDVKPALPTIAGRDEFMQFAAAA